MHADLRSRYQDDQDFLVTASTCDPRFKGMPFLDDVSKHQLFSKLVVIISERIQTNAAEIQVKQKHSSDDAPPLPEMPELLATEPDVTDAEPDTKTRGDSSSDSSPDKKIIKVEGGATNVLHEMFGDTIITQVEMKTKSPMEIAQEEVLRYQNELTPSLDTCALKWWNENSIYYPKLSFIAKKYLSVPSTSVPSERVFSTAGDVVTAQRSALKPKHVNRLIFLKKNLKLQ